jgi:hypothetical protein
MRRSITPGEAEMLRLVFGETLPYAEQQVDQNVARMGGSDMSITPGYIPNMANDLYTSDYADPTIDDDWKWWFIHEMTHVWQTCHGSHNIVRAVGLGLKYFLHYDDSYWYDLADSGSIAYFNLEQQGSIAADYWAVLHGLPTQRNNGGKRDLNSYLPYIRQIKGAGPPETAPVTEHPDREIRGKI